MITFFFPRCSAHPPQIVGWPLVLNFFSQLSPYASPLRPTSSFGLKAMEHGMPVEIYRVPFFDCLPVITCLPGPERIHQPIPQMVARPAQLVCDQVLIALG